MSGEIRHRPEPGTTQLSIVHGVTGGGLEGSQLEHAAEVLTGLLDTALGDTTRGNSAPDWMKDHLLDLGLSTDELPIVDRVELEIFKHNAEAAADLYGSLVPTREDDPDLVSDISPDRLQETEVITERRVSIWDSLWDIKGRPLEDDDERTILNKTRQLLHMQEKEGRTNNVPESEREKQADNIRSTVLRWFPELGDKISENQDIINSHLTTVQSLNSEQGVFLTERDMQTAKNTLSDTWQRISRVGILLPPSECREAWTRYEEARRVLNERYASSPSSEGVSHKVSYPKLPSIAERNEQNYLAQQMSLYQALDTRIEELFRKIARAENLNPDDARDVSLLPDLVGQRDYIARCIEGAGSDRLVNGTWLERSIDAADAAD